MKRIGFGAVITFLIIMALLTNVKHVSPQPVTRKQTKPFTVAHTGNQELSDPTITKLINDYRIQNGLQPLITVQGLVDSAKQKCADLQKYGIFAHEIPQSGVGTFYYPETDYPGANKYAENLVAVNSVNNDDPVQKWINSPEHRENILDPEMHFTGVASCNQNTYWTRPTDTRYVVEHFAS